MLSYSTIHLDSDPFQAEEGMLKITCRAIEDFAYSRYNIVRTNAQYCRTFLKNSTGISLIKETQQ
jgi:hypothetical protein